MQVAQHQFVEQCQRAQDVGLGRQACIAIRLQRIHRLQCVRGLQQVAHLPVGLGDVAVITDPQSGIGSWRSWCRQRCQCVGGASLLQLCLAPQQVALQCLVCNQIHRCQQLERLANTIPIVSRT